VLAELAAAAIAAKLTVNLAARSGAVMSALGAQNIRAGQVSPATKPAPATAAARDPRCGNGTRQGAVKMERRGSG
jgi:hypothetical protein